MASVERWWSGQLVRPITDTDRDRVAALTPATPLCWAHGVTEDGLKLARGICGPEGLGDPELTMLCIGQRDIAKVLSALGLVLDDRVSWVSLVRLQVDECVREGAPQELWQYLLPATDVPGLRVVHEPLDLTAVVIEAFPTSTQAGEAVPAMRVLPELPLDEKSPGVDDDIEGPWAEWVSEARARLASTTVPA